MLRRVLVIVPAYNEASSLPGLIGELRAAYPAFDLLVIDDGSTDETRVAVSRLPVRLISLPCNLGVGGAMQTGLLFALHHDYDVVIQVDGDGQHPPAEICMLLAGLEKSGSDMVLGSRFLSREGFQSTVGRRLGIRFFSVIVSVLCGTCITDATSGFRAWTRRAVRVLAEQYPEDYPEVEAILVLREAHLKISEVPVCMAERAAGKSSIGTAQALAYLIKVPLAIAMRIVRKREPQPQS